MTTVAAARRLGRILLGGSPSAQLDTDLLLGHVLGHKREELLTVDSTRLAPDQADEFVALLNRRAAGEPVAYLIGRRSFWRLEVEVTRDVLIPRPETECLVETSIAVATKVRARTLVDVGTGSGAIAVALATAMPECAVIAVDNSVAALRVAAGNVDALGLGSRVEIRHGHLLQSLTSEPGLIVANLPYIPDADRLGLPREVLHEPLGAILGGQDGLTVIRELLRQIACRGWLCPVVLEIDPRQVDALRVVAADLFRGRGLYVVKDLAGRDRVFVVESGEGRDANVSAMGRQPCAQMP